MKHKLWTVGSPISCLAEYSTWDNPHKPKPYYTREELLSGLLSSLFFFDNADAARACQKQHRVRCRHGAVIEAPAIYEVEVEELDFNLEAFQITKVLSAELHLKSNQLPGGRYTLNIPLVEEFPLAAGYWSLLFDSNKPDPMTKDNYMSNFELILLPYRFNALQVTLDKFEQENPNALLEPLPQDMIRHEFLPLMKKNADLEAQRDNGIFSMMNQCLPWMNL